ncbi:MAG: hypothetical protein H2056_00905 [Sphingopyxis sp.]|nr:hypothetical protein [Sphingopyxis sp.]
MVFPLLAPLSIDIAALKKNPTAVIADAGDQPVAVISDNAPVAYLLSANAWEDILDRLNNARLTATIRERKGQEAVRVSIDDFLGSGPIKCAFEASKWRRYRRKMSAVG